MPGLDNYLLDNYSIDGPKIPDEYKLYASGVAQSSGNYMNFDLGDGSWLQAVPLTVNGLGFHPTRIVIRKNDPRIISDVTIFDFSIKNSLPTENGANSNLCMYVSADLSVANAKTYLIQVWEYRGSGAKSQGAYMNDSAFRLPVGNLSSSYKWEAYKV